MKKNDLAGKYGLNVDPDLLSHDLAMLKLSKQKNIESLNDEQLYDTYVMFLHEIEDVVDSRTRYDSSLSK